GAALRRGHPDVGRSPVPGPRAVPQPRIPDLLHHHAVPVVDLAELGPPALDPETLHGDVKVELFEQQPADRIAGVEHKRPVLTIPGTPAQVPGLDHAALSRGHAAYA